METKKEQFVCFLCGKKIDVQNYEVHVSFCTGKGTSKPLIDPSKIQMPGPRAIQCYICKKAFFKSSLEIHIKTCIKSWEKRESLKPESQRKPIPTKPKNWDLMLQNLDKKPVKMPAQEAKIAENAEIYDPYGDEKFIADQFNDWMKKSLLPCTRCGRKFLPERMQSHLKFCKGPDEHPIKKAAK